VNSVSDMHIGDAVDEFALPDDRGERWSLAEHRGVPVVVIFHRHLM